MYKTLTIGGIDYRMEFTVEASLCSECIERLINFFKSTSAATVLGDENMTEEEADRAVQSAMNTTIAGLSDIGNVAMSLWYAGFLEHHGPEGDRAVLTKKDAKNLFRKYQEEHPDEGTYYDILRICTEQMEADDFFKLTGLDKLLTEEAPRPKKVPQDHRKKKASGTV